MTSNQEFNPLTIETDSVAITIDYTDQTNFKSGMRELKAQKQWMSQCKTEIESQLERLSAVYDDCVERYIDPDGKSSSTKTWIPRHLADLRPEDQQ